MRFFSISNWGKSIRHHWGILLLTFLLICGVGIPAIWFLIETKYRATASIRVAQIIPKILFSDKESENVMPMYDIFKSDQARLIVEDQRILIRVVDDLADEGHKFFESKSLPVEALKQAIRGGIITASPVQGSEMLSIYVVSTEPQEAVQIAGSFRTAYMSIEGSKSSLEGDQKLQLLENERKVFAEKLKLQRRMLRQLAEEYGTVELNPREEIMLQRVAVLKDLATKIDADKLLLEIKIELLEKTKDEPISQRALLERRRTFIQNDLLVQMLTRRIAQFEEELISTGQITSSENPELRQRAELLETFKTNLEKHRKKVEKTFDESITEELSENREAGLADAKLELRGLIAQREILQAKIDKEDTNTIKLGRKQLDTTEQQEQLALTKEVYDTIRRRIQQLEMERKRPARVSVPYETTVAPMPDKRVKYTIALISGAMASGMLLAFLREKA